MPRKKNGYGNFAVNSVKVLTIELIEGRTVVPLVVTHLSVALDQHLQGQQLSNTTMKVVGPSGVED